MLPFIQPPKKAFATKNSPFMACTPPASPLPPLQLGGGKNFTKVLAWGGGGSEIFILVGDVLWLGESNFVGESPEILKENLKL